MGFSENVKTVLNCSFPELAFSQSNYSNELCGVENVCGKAVFHLFEEACFTLLQSKPNLDVALSLSQSVLDISWEKINTGYWKDVTVEWRKMYAYGAIMKSLSLSRMGRMQEAVKSCDMGLLLGWPVMDNVLTNIVNCIQKKLTSDHDEKITTNHTINHQSTNVDKSQDLAEVPQQSLTLNSDSTVLYSPNKKARLITGNNTTKETSCIERLKCPSLGTFQSEFMDKEKPIILEGVMNHWPAMTSRRWSFSYLKDIAGHRTVPVEIGSRYTDESWTQKLMTINEFVNGYVTKASGEIHSDKVAYLAQHQLFDQIPELANDICIPDYCCLGDENGEDVIINAWFGPQGTVSPLHHDPYHNLLAQVVGEKYIHVYSSSETEKLYPHDSFLLSNTSQVDVESPDLEKFPSFKTAVHKECILKAGEMLYIPRKHWHFVKSLSVSFSVSFWWS